MTNNKEETKDRGGYKQISKTLNICAFENYLDTQQALLPKLPNIEQLSRRVIRILGQNPGNFSLQGTNTYIVGTGAERLIIDTGQGIPAWAELVSSMLTDASITLSHVLLTHWHGDHTGGVPDLLRLYPDLSTSVYKHTPGKGQQSIVDKETFSVEGATIRAVHSPGHSHDHMCFILEEENAMFTGDNILGHGTTAVEELNIYMSSLRKMQGQKCDIGYPAHGVVNTNLSAKIAGELAQKVSREKKILKTLKGVKAEEVSAGRGKTGSVTVKQLVATMHGEKIDEQVREKALEPFTEEVLGKLAEDGDVAYEMKGGQKKWFGVEHTVTA